MPPLPHGLILRNAAPADIPAIGALLAERGDDNDAADLELVVATEGLDSVAVVVDGERVVSTLTLLDEIMHIGGVAVPAGQVEMVATDPDYEHRGLVRALMQWAHARSEARGHLLGVMIGIPYFYRQFGYHYAAPMGTWHHFVREPAVDAGIVVRRAAPTDIAAMAHIQDVAQASADIRMPHGTACWHWLVARGGSEQWVAERGGSVCATARSLPPDEGAAVAEIAATDDGALTTLLAHLSSRTDEPIAVQRRVGADRALADLLGDPIEPADWYYGRIGRFGPLLAHLAPLFCERLAGAGLADRMHDVLISSWRSHVRFRIGPEGFDLVAEGGPEQAPVSKGGSGIAPDDLPTLLLGPHGALGLEQARPDCYLGRQRDLMAALFPPQTADLLTFYLPV